MERLRDLRVDLQLDVKVWGMDSSGKPFRHDAKNIEIGALGARLSGILGVQKKTSSVSSTVIKKHDFASRG